MKLRTGPGTRYLIDRERRTRSRIMEDEISNAGISINLTFLFNFVTGKPGLTATTKFESFKTSSMFFHDSSSLSESEPVIKNNSAFFPYLFLNLRNVSTE